MITTQAFQATACNHVPASVVGILIGVAVFVIHMAKTGIRVPDLGLGAVHSTEKSGPQLSRQPFLAMTSQFKTSFPSNRGRFSAL